MLHLSPSMCMSHLLLDLLEVNCLFALRYIVPSLAFVEEDITALMITALLGSRHCLEGIACCWIGKNILLHILFVLSFCCSVQCKCVQAWSFCLHCMWLLHPLVGLHSLTTVSLFSSSLALVSLVWLQLRWVLWGWWYWPCLCNIVWGFLSLLGHILSSLWIMRGMCYCLCILCLCSILRNYLVGVQWVLDICWLLLFESNRCFLDVSWHVNMCLLVYVFPFNGESNLFCCLSNYCHWIMFLIV